jgi:hypothetical protein
VAPRTDFTPDYTPDFHPDGAASDGGATGALGTASVTLVAGTIAAQGNAPPVTPSHGPLGGSRIRLRRSPDRVPEYELRIGKAFLPAAEVAIEASPIFARGAVAGRLGDHSTARITAGTIHARGIQNLSEDDLLAVALLVADDCLTRC